MRVNPATGEILEPRRVPTFRPAPLTDALERRMLRAALIARFAILVGAVVGLIALAVFVLIVQPVGLLIGAAGLVTVRLLRGRS